MIRTVLLCMALALTAALSSPLRAAASDKGENILVMLRVPPPHFRAGGSYDSGYGNRLGDVQSSRKARRIARDHHLALVTSWMMPIIDLNCFLMRLPKGASAERAAAEVSKDPAVLWSQPLHDYRTLSGNMLHNDPLYPAQPAKVRWRLDSLHRLATGRGTTVAVIDSGIDARHPDLVSQIKSNLNFVAGRAMAAEHHGTAVAGIIAAKADNGIGIVGIAPGARLLGLRACRQEGGGAAICDSLSLAKALHHAIGRGADIVNLSLSGPPDRLLSTLLDAGIARGTQMVAAYDPHQADGGFPASHNGVIAVVASSPSAPVSRLGRTIYVAPAWGIPTTQPGGTWGLVDGTSYAAAHVSGLVALMDETARHRRRRLALVTSGGGVIDALATVQGKAEGCNGPCPAPLAAASRD